MPRKKVKLAFIVNDTARKTAYKKRKNSLLKMVAELSTLCGVDACAIVYGPDDPRPEICPSPRGVQSVVSKFLMMPELEQGKKMVDQETFLRHMISRAEEQLNKQRKKNKVKKVDNFMIECLAAGMIVNDNVDIDELGGLIDQNLNEIHKRLELLDMNDRVMAPSQVHVAAPAPVLETAPTMVNNEDRVLMDQTLGLNLNVDNIQMLMNNGNWNETLPFGYVNLPMGL